MALISAKEVFKKIDSDARYLFASKSGCVYWSECEPQKGTSISCPEQGKIGLWSYTNNIKEFQGLSPRSCVIENPNVISKMVGKLCWFWDNFSCENGIGVKDYVPYESRVLGILGKYSEGEFFPFIIKGDLGEFTSCEPVQKSELKGMLYNGK